MAYTEHAPRRQQVHVAYISHVTTKQRLIHFGGYIQNVLCNATVTHSESHTTRAQWVCSEENSVKQVIVSIVKHLGRSSR